MKFDKYQMLRDRALEMSAAEEKTLPPTNELHPIVLAYIGDVVFSMYTRLRLVPVSHKVQVLHDIDAKMVSAVMQCKAMKALELELTEGEEAAFKRGRNAKSTVPKSASVAEYRIATGFEALLGYLFLEDRQERLDYILSKSYAVIAEEMKKNSTKLQ